MVVVATHLHDCFLSLHKQLRRDGYDKSSSCGSRSSQPCIAQSTGGVIPHISYVDRQPLSRNINKTHYNTRHNMPSIYDTSPLSLGNSTNVRVVELLPSPTEDGDADLPIAYKLHTIPLNNPLPYTALLYT